MRRIEAWRLIQNIYLPGAATLRTPELEAESKWKAIGDRALATWRFDLARESFERAGDLSALMVLLLSIGDKEGLAKLAAVAGTTP